jgi:hypothetical protein
MSVVILMLTEYYAACIVVKFFCLECFDYFVQACGARIMAEDTGIIRAQNSIALYGNHNCSWIIIAPNPGTVPDSSMARIFQTSIFLLS